VPRPAHNGSRVREHGGGLTFVFTDIEGSTQLLRDLGTTYGLLLRIHRRILSTCFAERSGRELGSEGDGLFYVFPTPDDAVGAAITAQRKLAGYAWPDGVRLRVRMGIHRGPVSVSGGEYVGLTVHEAARISASAHGGQILCSSAVVDDLEAPPPEGAFLDLGSYLLRGIPTSHTLWQVCAAELAADFPPPRDAVRHGGTRVTIWQREAANPAPRDHGPAPAPAFRALVPEVDVEVAQASNGTAGAFRVVVRHRGTVVEEYDGLTTGGANDAAAIVNAHSRLIRVE
jgi:class 3 adenylate cyclase